MIVTITSLNWFPSPATPTSFTVSFSVVPPNGQTTYYTTAPIDLASYLALTAPQKASALIAAARTAAIPPVAPNIGLTVGQTFDIGS